MSFKKAPLLFIVFLLLFTGCKVLSPLNQPKEIPLPSSYHGKSDSTGIGNMQWNEFFKDSILIGLIDTALKNNFDMQIALQRIEIARANAQVAKASIFPSVSAVASAGVERYGKYTMNGVGNYDTNFSDNLTNDQKIPTPTPDYFLGFKSSWEIDIWGKLKNRKKAAFARYLSSEKGKLLVQTSVVAEVAARYYKLLALDNELGIIKKNIGLQEKALEVIKIQKIGGRATELAVQQFEAQLLRTKTLEIEKEQDIYRTENLLNILLGRFTGKIKRGDSIQNYSLPKEVQVGIPSDLLLRRPDIQQAELELKAAKADVEAARAAALPSFTITPYLGLNSFNAAQLFNPYSLALGIAGGLSGPIFNRKNIKANYSRSMAEGRKAFYSYHKAIVNGYQEVLTSLKSIDNLNRMRMLKAQEVKVLQNAVATSNDLFLAGYASYLEVVTAQGNVLEAELGLVSIRKNQFLSLIELYRALGGGWETL